MAAAAVAIRMAHPIPTAEDRKAVVAEEMRPAARARRPTIASPRPPVIAAGAAKVRHADRTEGWVN